MSNKKLESNIKRRQTCLAKYGVENPRQLLDIQNKAKQTCLDRYGYDNPTKSPEIQDKIKKTNFSGQLININDNRYSNISDEQNGFNLIAIIQPNYRYLKSNLLECIENYPKNKLAHIFDLDPTYVELKTEWEIMQEQGYDRLWDAGQTKWVKII